MRRCRSTQGFTLFEMAVVLVIMGTIAALAAPGIGEYMADARAAAVTEELVRINRVIRARVNQTGLAHLLRFTSTNDAAGGNGLGRLQVWEGMNNRCRQTPWLAAINGTAADGHFAVEQLNVNDPAYNTSSTGNPAAGDTNRQVIQVQALVNALVTTQLLLCFEPGGRTLTATSDGTSAAIGFTFTDQLSPVQFQVTRSYTPSGGGSAQQRGVMREVIYPAGGNGRFRL